MKLVAISDLHLGQTGADGMGQYSLLSAKAPNNMVKQFAAAVAKFCAGTPTTLLITGDLLDLSLSYMAEALDDLHQLLKALTIAPIVEIVYLIGNHDHHMWMLHSEETRLLSGLRKGNLPPIDALTPANMAAYQVTSQVGEPFVLLQPLVDRVFTSRGVKCKIAYPSFTRQFQNKLIYATHGHLMGGLYTALSDLLKTRLAHLPHDQVAATVNQPVIELLYWLLGEAGDGIGADGLLEQIYTDAQKGKDSTLRDVVTTGVAQALPGGIIPLIPDSWERAWVVNALMKKLDSVLTSPSAASNAAQARFADIEDTRQQLLTWMKAVPPLKDLPSNTPVHILYGHTHVWDRYQFPASNTTSWNLNTWLVEPGHEIPRTGFLGISSDSAVAWYDVLT